MSIILGLFGLAVVVASLLGGALPLASAPGHTRLQLYLSFAAGVMLGAAFFHMLPEAVAEGGPSALHWTAAGLLALFFLERFFAYHQHEAEPDHGHGGHDHRHDHAHAPQKGGLHWGAAAFGLAVHSVVGGVALASAIAADIAARGRPGPASWGVFLATVLHKPADALTIISLLLRAGASRGLAHLINLAFALMIPAGMVLFAIGLGRLAPDSAGHFTANALAFSAGTFLCIALSDLLPELHFHAHDRLKLSGALLAGVGLMAASSLWEGFLGL